jgi:hypothetical protein
MEKYKGSFWKLLVESKRIWGVLFILLIICCVTYQALFNDWTYIYGTLGFCVPLVLLLIMNSIHLKELRNGKSS